MSATIAIDTSYKQNTTPLGRRIVEIADRWAQLKCVEEKNNRGQCIDKVHQLYNGRILNEAYCAKFAYVVVQEACEALNIANKLPKTASALGMLQGAQKLGMAVQGLSGIAPGAVFARRTKATGGSGWHVGLVRSWNDDKFFTVEGNNSDRIGYFNYDWEEIKSRDFWFIHTHRMSENFQYIQKTVTETAQKAKETVEQNPALTLALLAALGTGVYFIAKKKR